MFQKKGPFTSLSFWLLVSLTLYLSPIREIRVSKQHTRNTASWEVGIGERSKVRVGGKVKVGDKCLGDWHLPPNVYFSCTCPNFSLFKWMNHCMSECISEHYNCVGTCDGLSFRAVTSVPCALLFQHLARSAIGVAHDDRAALFAAD